MLILNNFKNTLNYIFSIRNLKLYFKYFYILLIPVFLGTTIHFYRITTAQQKYINQLEQKIRTQNDSIHNLSQKITDLQQKIDVLQKQKKQYYQSLVKILNTDKNLHKIVRDLRKELTIIEREKEKLEKSE